MDGLSELKREATQAHRKGTLISIQSYPTQTAEACDMCLTCIEHSSRNTKLTALRRASSIAEQL